MYFTYFPYFVNTLQKKSKEPRTTFKYDSGPLGSDTLQSSILCTVHDLRAITFYLHIDGNLVGGDDMG